MTMLQQKTSLQQIVMRSMMTRPILRFVVASFVVLTMVNYGVCELKSEAEWWNWRGPNLNGTAAAGQTPPTTWSETDNIIWKVPVPGRGHSSPIVVGDKIVLSTADESAKTQSVICFDRKSGAQLWQTVVNKGGFTAKIHTKNTHASPSVTTDGTHLFASFNNNEAVQLAALDLSGKIVWQKKAGDYMPSTYKFGYGPSPLVYGDTVIVSSEFESNGFLAAFRGSSGQEVWRTQRPKFNSYSSPIVGRVSGRDQLLISGAELVCSYDPSNGDAMWKCPGTSKATCGTMVWSKDIVFASGGYPKKETIAVRGSDGQVLWRNKEKCYEQSMVYHDGYLYAMNDGGIALCWKGDTGEEMWKSRLGGPVSSSPVLAGGNIYVSNERGKTFVFQASPTGFKAVAQNQLGDEAFATPAFVGNRIYARAADRSSGKRIETLYCIGR